MEVLPELPKPGAVLAGKYELGRMLGMGGMGAVFEAKHLRLRQRVAIKLLKPELVMNADCVARFEREGRAAARMTSPNAARIYDVDATPSGIPYMVIEFLEGRDLAAELRERATLPVEEAVDVVVQACSAMAEAHALGIVHRDLKPANLFLCGKGQGRVVKVLDFGVSKILADDLPQTTTPSLTLGTPQYMSPEQIMASKDVDLRSDVWSLGVILYKLLSGRLPFESDSATAFVVTVVTTEPAPIDERATAPGALCAAVMKALAKDREARWPSVEALAKAIEPFGSGRFAFRPATLPPPSATPKAAPKAPESDPDARTVTQTTPAVSSATSAADAPPTEGNWTQPSAPFRPRRRVGRAVAIAALVGVVAVGAAVAMRATSSERADLTPPTASSTPTPPLAASSAPAASSPLPLEATSAAPTAPSPSASSTPSAAPPPHKSAPPVRPAAAPAGAKSAATPRATAPAPSASPTRDPVHL